MHRPGLEGAQGEKGVKELHLGEFERKFSLRSSICRVLLRLSGRSRLDFVRRGHNDAAPAGLRLLNRRVIFLMSVSLRFSQRGRWANRRRETGRYRREPGLAHRRAGVRAHAIHCCARPATSPRDLPIGVRDLPRTVFATYSDSGGQGDPGRPGSNRHGKKRLSTRREWGRHRIDRAREERP